MYNIYGTFLPCCIFKGGTFMLTYTIDVAGLKRDLPICKVTEDLYIGAFICFGDAELTEVCAGELLKLADADSYDYMLTAEAKSIPIIHEMARQSGAKKYFVARKGICRFGGSERNGGTVAFAQEKFA